MSPREVVLWLPGALTAGHQLMELCAGSGVIGRRHVGLLPAASLSMLIDALLVAAAPNRRSAALGNAVAFRQLAADHAYGSPPRASGTRSGWNRAWPK